MFEVSACFYLLFYCSIQILITFCEINYFRKHYGNEGRLSVKRGPTQHHYCSPVMLFMSFSIYQFLTIPTLMHNVLSRFSTGAVVRNCGRTRYMHNDTIVITTYSLLGTSKRAVNGNNN
uniref:Uncharacterized protein n=1 Tax=Sipha flava TaxID=143950 RepID=A0A2S2QJM5_9HEMI